jgi:hypothetical protein
LLDRPFLPRLSAYILRKANTIVVDLSSSYVCLGTLVRLDADFLELKNADLRDTETTRENYVAASRATGIKRNRKRLLLVRADMVAVARLEDVVDE